MPHLQWPGATLDAARDAGDNRQMNNGGIFGGPTALGYLGLGQDSGAKPCQGVAFHKELQAELKRRGYNVRQDAIWDGCCQSALIKEIGAPMATTAQVKQFLGHACSSGALEPVGTLLPGPLQTVVPSCADGSDKKGSTPNTIPACPTGQIYDLNMGRCVPTADPYGCSAKCNKHAMLSAQWAQCLLECNAAGANLSVPPVPQPPGPKPPGPTIDPTDAIEPSAAEVLGGNLPLIVGALAVGVTAAVYFATRKKPAPTKALANRKRRKKKSRTKGRR